MPISVPASFGENSVEKILTFHPGQQPDAKYILIQLFAGDYCDYTLILNNLDIKRVTVSSEHSKNKSFDFVLL